MTMAVRSGAGAGSGMARTLRRVGLTGTVQIRPATPDDVAAVVHLVHLAYRGTAERGWTTEADLLDGQRTDADEVASLLADLHVAERDDTLLGCFVLDRHGHFGMFAVLPGAQAGGVGSALLARAEQLARERGHDHVEMHVLRQRHELLAFYARRGYAPTGDTRPFPYGDERFGLPRREDLEFVVLRKPLSSAAQVEG